MLVRFAIPDDAAAIAKIYNHYIEHTVITFEEEPISAAEVCRRMNQVTELGFPWLVAEHFPSQRTGESYHDTVESRNLVDSSAIVGYAYAGTFRERQSFRFSVETAIYMDVSSINSGYGSILYQNLIDELAKLKLHRAVAAISLPNKPSVRLHEKFGFQHVGTFTEVGYKFDQWINVGFWECNLAKQLRE